MHHTLCFPGCVVVSEREFDLNAKLPQTRADLDSSDCDVYKSSKLDLLRSTYLSEMRVDMRESDHRRARSVSSLALSL